MENPDYHVYCHIKHPGSYPSSETWPHPTLFSYSLVSYRGKRIAAAPDIVPRFMMVAWQKDSTYRKSENGLEDICYVFPDCGDYLSNQILARPLGDDKEYALGGRDLLRELTEEERAQVERRVKEIERDKEIARLSEAIAKVKQQIDNKKRSLEALERQLSEYTAGPDRVF